MATIPNRHADIVQHARNRSGIGNRKRKQDAPMYREGLCPQGNED